ncbi:MAG: hypothetical protein IIZ21_03705 [Firmicutes bacterium]|nr:hypothetical protein [Bacillota bacterium]
MRLEIKEKGNEAFYREAINVATQYRRLLQKPERKLTDYFKAYKIYTILCAVLAVLIAAMNIAWGWDTLGTVALVALIIVAIFSAAFWKRLNGLQKSMMDDPRMSVFTMDENGVELNKGDSQTVRMSWDNLAFVRIFDESISFFTKDGMGFIITVNRRYAKEILEYLQAERPDVKIVR